MPPTTTPASAFASPAKIITVTKKVSTVTSTITRAVQQVAGGNNLVATLTDVGIGVAILAVIIIIIALALRRRGPSTYYSRNLAMAIRDPTVDAVGLILHLDKATASILPLRRVEGLYVSTDPHKPMIVISNPYASTFSIEGKPLIVAVAVSKMSHHIDVPAMTSLGLARIAIDDPLWDETSEPNKALEKLISKLSAMVGTRQGRIRISPTTSIAFQMSIPTVLRTLLSQTLDFMNSIVIHLVDTTRAIEDIAKSLKLHKAIETQAKASAVMKIATALAGVAAVIGMLWLLSQLFAHGGVP